MADFKPAKYVDFGCIKAIEMLMKIGPEKHDCPFQNNMQTFGIYFIFCLFINLSERKRAPKVHYFVSYDIRMAVGFNPFISGVTKICHQYVGMLH